MLTRKNLSIVLFLLIPAFAFICSDDAEPKCSGAEESVQITEFKGADGTVPCRIYDKPSGSTFIIQTQTEFDDLMTCYSEFSPIDFNKSTVLAGLYQTGATDKVLEQTVVRICDDYTYHVEIGGGIGAYSVTVFYVAIVPKLATTTKVKFDVNYIR
jgi:hypothetical protein